MNSDAPACYPQPGKAISRQVLEAFAAGSGGRIASQTTALEPGALAVYGAVGLEHLVRLARAEGRDWYYGDNAYFDVARKRFYRFARNAFQATAPQPPDEARLRALGLTVAPWQAGGGHIVLVEQSPQFLELSGTTKHWLVKTMRELKAHTDRPLRPRLWNRDKAKASSTLQADLNGAWALVTHMSAAANEALLAGVPVFVSGPCAAAPFASGDLSRIESPRRPDGRQEWAAGLANSQWTIEEIRAGIAWGRLKA